MSAQQQRSSSTKPLGAPPVLQLPAKPDDVWEVPLSPREVLRLRAVGAKVQGVLYRLRRPNEKGDPIVRFSVELSSLESVVVELLEQSKSQSEWRTVVAYLRASPRGARLP